MIQAINRRRYVKGSDVDKNYIITYRASEKLTETTSTTYDIGLHVNSFFDDAVEQLTMVSHTFSGGRGIIVFNGDVAYIGEFAFCECSSLTSITIPNSVTSIGNATFLNCNLTSITIPNSVASIGNSAFLNCILTSITIPNSVTSIGESAFSGCILTSITIPNSVTSIGESAFSGCRGLASITVESENTFYDSRGNCNAIIETSTNTLIAGCMNTIIPNSVTSIGQAAFASCSGLTSVTIGNSVTSIGNFAFYGCNGLTSITIPNSVTSIGSGAFQNCNGLTTVNIPNSVTSIGQAAFASCSGLTSVTIGNSVISIGNSAFGSCSGLTSVTIGSSVTSIGSGAFSGCSKLTNITCSATTAPTITNNTFQNVKTGGKLYVPTGSTGYNTWMRTGNYYLGKYKWTKVTY